MFTGFYELDFDVVLDENYFPLYLEDYVPYLFIFHQRESLLFDA